MPAQNISENEPLAIHVKTKVLFMPKLLLLLDLELSLSN